MADLLCLDLVDKGVVTESISMYIGYSEYLGVTPARGSIRIDMPTSSSKKILVYIEKLYKDIVDRALKMRRVNISFNDITDETYTQYDLFVNPDEIEKERKLQRAMIDVKKKFGKNAVLKGMNLEKGGTTIERNNQIGGHKSGT